MPTRTHSLLALLVAGRLQLYVLVRGALDSDTMLDEHHPDLCPALERTSVTAKRTISA